MFYLFNSNHWTTHMPKPSWNSDPPTHHTRYAWWTAQCQVYRLLSRVASANFGRRSKVKPPLHAIFYRLLRSAHLPARGQRLKPPFKPNARMSGTRWRALWWLSRPQKGNTLCPDVYNILQPFCSLEMFRRGVVGTPTEIKTAVQHSSLKAFMSHFKYNFGVFQDARVFVAKIIE